MNIKVDNVSAAIAGAEERLLLGQELDFAEALRLLDSGESHAAELAAAARRIRRRFSRDSADLCSIINARSGKCGEDCRFCSQSGRYQTDAPVYGMKPATEILAAAKAAAAAGAHRFCIVTSGGSLSETDFGVVLEALSLIGTQTKLKRCASLGRLNRSRIRELKKAGLDRYHHNIETCESFFGQICSTHTYQERIKTIRLLKESGIETCIGGILNLGESLRQRIEFIFELKRLKPDSIPINFLIAKEGTPLAGRPAMPALEAARCLAVFRLVIPDASLRIAGGRLETFGPKPALPFESGANALLIGDLLTTRGPKTKSDITLLDCLGFDLNGGR